MGSLFPWVSPTRRRLIVASPKPLLAHTLAGPFSLPYRLHTIPDLSISHLKLCCRIRRH